MDDADKFFHNFFLERARRDDDRGFSRATDGDDGAEDEAFDLLEEDQIERVVSTCTFLMLGHFA